MNPYTSHLLAKVIALVMYISNWGLKKKIFGEAFGLQQQI
jgi:hypothetical protein